MLNRPDPDYSRVYDGSPTIGDFVEFDHDGREWSGVVIDLLIAHRGPLLVVRIEPNRTVDIHWQRVQLCDMPDDWPAESAQSFIESQQATCFDMLDDRR